MPGRARKLLLVALLVGVAGGLPFCWWRKPEPAYQGRPLSSWFYQYARSGWPTGEHTEAQLALHALGTNALPFLLEQYFSAANESPLATNLAPFLNALRGPLRLPPPLSPQELQHAAGDALKELKPSAEWVLPYVTNAFAQPCLDQQCRAIFLLGEVGAHAQATVPWLRRALQGPHWFERVLALQSVKWLGPAVQDTVPDLTHLLTNPPVPANLVCALGEALGSMGPGAAPALPALQERLAMETNLSVRLVLAGALCRIAPTQSNSLAQIVAELRGALDPERFSSVLFGLGNIGPNARVAVPFLQDLLASPKMDVWFGAAQAMERIGADKSACLPALLPKLEHRSELIRYNAANLILAIDRSNAPARDVLLDLIRKQSPFTGLAIADLAKTGAAARPAVPLLREISRTRDKTLRKTAAVSLQQIEGAAP